MRKRAIRVIVATIAFALGLATTTSALPASAAPLHQSEQGIGEHDHTESTGRTDVTYRGVAADNIYGKAQFARQGEWFRVRDKRADGLPVVVQWKFYTADLSSLKRSGMIWNLRGANDGWTYQNKSFAESGGVKRLHFRVCAGYHPDHIPGTPSCSGWSKVIT